MTQPPSPPSAEERDLYYFGLPSRPKLVARSSVHPWVNPQMPGPTTFTGTANMYPKSFLPVGRHPLLHQLWNDATSSLRVRIVEAVSLADWTAIDILRVGLNSEYHITLLISVAPDTLSWSRGHAIALRCKSILEHHGINGVHCEIRESVVTFCTDSAPKPSNTFKLSSAPIKVEDYYASLYADLSDCLGTRIATKHLPFRAGTKGLYLSLSPSSPGGEPKIVALTCRHVVFDSQAEGTREYRRPQSGTLTEAIQIDQPTYEHTLQTLSQNVPKHRQYAVVHKSDASSVALFNTMANNAIALGKTLKSFEAPSSRVFGQVLYSPEFTTASDRGAKWLRDWALIELLPRSHQASLRSVKNKVFIGSTMKFVSLTDDGKKKGLAGLEIPGPPPLKDGFVELEKAIVPLAEIRKPEEVAYNDEPVIIVAKYGAATGFSLGLGSPLVSVIRTIETPDGEKSMMSEEWPIVSIFLAGDREAKFSAKGDSGSCIWDMQRRPAGILTSGNGVNGLNDVTYAQPLERIIADIKAHGFDVSLV